MSREIRDLNDLQQAADLVDGYMVGVTLLEGGKLTHYLINHKFPLVDMLKSAAEVKKLVVSQLENPEPPLPEF
jgi:hypothetical protein